MNSLPGRREGTEVTREIELLDEGLEGCEVLFDRVLVGNGAPKVPTGAAVPVPAFVVLNEGGGGVEPLKVLDEVGQRQGGGAVTVPFTHIIRAEVVQKLLVTGPVVRRG